MKGKFIEMLNAEPSWRIGFVACHDMNWLEELASESNTIQAQEDISWSGMIAGKYQVKLYIR